MTSIAKPSIYAVWLEFCGSPCSLVGLVKVAMACFFATHFLDWVYIVHTFLDVV